MAEQKLKRNLSFISMIALASGAVIGGWLAEAPYWFSVTGAGAALIFPILAILLIPVGLTFAELTAMLPFASSVDIWTTSAFGHKTGFAAQWMMFLVQVVEPPMMAFIFITAFGYFIPIPQNMQIWIAIAIVVLWYIMSNFNVGITGMLANIFFFAMIIMSLIVSCTLLFSGHWSAGNLTANGGFFPQGFKGIFVAMAVFSLKFIGFEMTPTMIEETNFPVSKMWKVILSALFVPALLYFIVVIAIGGMGSWDIVVAMNMPEPEFVAMYSLPKIVAIMAIVAGILHATTTLMGFWTSSARVLYGAAQLNQLPKAFAKLNKKGQPVVANFVCCLDALVLRKKHPDWKRPYKVPGGTIIFILGMLISVWVIIGSCLELAIGGYISLIIYCLLGVAMYMVMGQYRKKDPKEHALITLTPDDIDKGY